MVPAETDHAPEIPGFHSTQGSRGALKTFTNVDARVRVEDLLRERRAGKG